ncbi:LuxR C-terminal-related transcriptional regulator [Amycolatopsis sp. NPDC058340]|uniref:LuxR C-terminal-related transcriptional regulator n=1 Tax=Amycolatopsis sp. NPDC058340 TaxID=3346453 RepID=UPI00365BBA9B
MAVINPVFVVDADETAISGAMAELRSFGRAVPVIRVADVEPATRLDPRRAIENPLSVRQAEVLRLIAEEGLNAGQIGLRLGISGVSVRTHLDKIFRKLNVNSRPEAVAVAIRRGILGGGA